MSVCYVTSHTWLEVLMSTPPFRYSKTLSMFPALAARRKLVLLSDWKRHRRKTLLNRIDMKHISVKQDNQATFFLKDFDPTLSLMSHTQTNSQQPVHLSEYWTQPESPSNNSTFLLLCYNLVSDKKHINNCAAMFVSLCAQWCLRPWSGQDMSTVSVWMPSELQLETDQDCKEAEWFSTFLLVPSLKLNPGSHAARSTLTALSCGKTLCLLLLHSLRSEVRYRNTVVAHSGTAAEPLLVDTSADVLLVFMLMNGFISYQGHSLPS